MRTIPKRVQNAYFQLHKSRLISKGHLDNDAIKHFENILNSAMPQNEYENNIYYFVKDMYYNDPSKFLSFINKSNLQSLILYTNNKNIITHFNLQYKIYISWNTKDRKYNVELYNSPKNKTTISRNNSTDNLEKFTQELANKFSSIDSRSSFNSMSSRASFNSVSSYNSSTEFDGSTIDSNKCYLNLIKQL